VHFSENKGKQGDRKQAAQKAVRGALRSTGKKVSLNMVGKTAAKVGKIAGWAGTFLTLNDGRSAFQRCMSNQD